MYAVKQSFCARCSRAAHGMGRSLRVKRDKWRDFAVNAAILIGLVAMLGVAEARQQASAAEPVMQGRVASVSDGDSLTIRIAGEPDRRIRLAGIDAPERGQPFADTATRALRDRTQGREVRVEVVGVDRFGRSVGVVWVDGINVNRAMVVEGMAWHFDAGRSRSASDRTNFANEQHRARAARAGLWFDPSPVEPQVFRRASR